MKIVGEAWRQLTKEERQRWCFDPPPAKLADKGSAALDTSARDAAPAAVALSPKPGAGHPLLGAPLAGPFHPVTDATVAGGEGASGRAGVGGVTKHYSTGGMGMGMLRMPAALAGEVDAMMPPPRGYKAELTQV